jgi:hypothetical protein
MRQLAKLMKWKPNNCRTRPIVNESSNITFKTALMAINILHVPCNDDLNKFYF